MGALFPGFCFRKNQAVKNRLRIAALAYGPLNAALRTYRRGLKTGLVFPVINSGRKIRGFNGGKNSGADSPNQPPVPFFKFSFRRTSGMVRS